MRVLVVNAGSSSLKLRLLDDRDEVVASRDLPAPKGEADREQLAAAIGRMEGIDAVGHRIVHGGTQFLGPVLINPSVVAQLRALSDLAPLHQPKSLAALEAVSSVLPDLPAVGCFDTAFHANMPEAAATYALPREWRRRWSLRRYGFHGLSHAYASQRVRSLIGSGEANRIVVCHLGAGASLCAVRDGKSVDTTMGFTPLEGLVMATRSGSVDPGLVLWLEEHAGTPSSELAATLEYRSGLLGLAGTADMRAIVVRSIQGDAEATLALDVYIHRLSCSIAAMAAAMNGLEVLVFTGGVGENSPEVRARTAEGLEFLGVGVDEDRSATEGDREITRPGATVRAFVIAAREDLEIARQVRSVVPLNP